MTNQNRIVIHEEGKIDIHHRKARYDLALAKHESRSDLIPENGRLIMTFLRDCALGKTLRGRAKKKIGPGRCLKYLGILQRLSLEFGKSFHDVNQEDMERFVLELESDRMMSAKGKPYAEATKGDIKKSIRKFWKWKDGNCRTYPDIVEWIDTSEVIKEVSALTRDEVEQMIDATASPRDRALIMVLFDSGARAEELLNVRMKPEHVFWKEELSCYMMRIEFSKTKPRTISLPLSKELLRKWLEVHPARANPCAQLFPMTYPAMKMVVHRLGRKALGKTVTPHVLRHTSATFYANRLKSPYTLCRRYGWTMASNMVNRYLDRAGILEEETALSVRNEEMGNLAKQNLTLQEELVQLKESFSEIASELSNFRSQIDHTVGGQNSNTDGGFDPIQSG